jgi:hypothetical protein
MKTNILIYHENKYDLTQFANVIAFYRKFFTINSTRRTISELINAGVFAYCPFNDVYFHVRSSASTRVTTADGETHNYYTGVYNTHNKPARNCMYSGLNYFRDSVAWIELNSGGYVNAIHEHHLHSYNGRWFVSEADMISWKRYNIRYVSPYHSDSSSEYIFDDIKPERFQVGFEVEKEDINVRNSISINDFKTATGGYWRKESDSSLDSNSGFELISPYMDFNVDRIAQYLHESDVIIQHINAEYDLATCGGHINLSDKQQNGIELFESISGYVPVLYSMYSNRLRSGYSQGLKKEELKHGARAAVCVKPNRIELRLFPAIRNVDILLFRLRLLRFMCENFTEDYSTALKNLRQNSDLFIGIYNRETLSRMLRRAEFYAIDYEFSPEINYTHLG